MRRVFVLLILTLSTHLFAAPKFKGSSAAGGKLTVDFSKPLFSFNKSDNANLIKMKEMALDFCKIQKITYNTMVLTLTPVLDLKGYDVFYTFLALHSTGRILVCNVVADKAFQWYSAGCYYTGKK